MQKIKKVEEISTEMQNRLTGGRSCTCSCTCSCAIDSVKADTKSVTVDTRSLSKFAGL